MLLPKGLSNRFSKLDKIGIPVYVELRRALKYRLAFVVCYYFVLSIPYRAFAICKGAGDHIGFEDFMEIVRVGEADFFGYFVYGSIRHCQQAESVIYSYAVDVVDWCCAYTVLEHFCKIVRRDTDHISKGLNIYLLGVVCGYVLNNRTKSDNIMIYHTVKLVSLSCVVAKNG